MKKKLIFIILLFTLFVTSGCSIKFNKKIDHDSTPDIMREPEEVWPKIDKLSLIASGDALAHNTLYDWYKQPDGSYNHDNIFSEITDLVQQYDLAYYNQETVFGGEKLGYSNYPRFNTPSSFGDSLLKTGFNLVSLATNHSMDKGINGATNSALWWEEKDNVYATGMATSLEKRNTIKIEEVNGITFAMISYTYGTNGINIPKGYEYLVNIYSDEQAKIDVESIRDKVDLLIVAMHWGVEYQHKPNQTQVRQAEYLSSLGVDLILGNHSHCVQSIDFINDTFVVYSMGNLIAHQAVDRMMKSYGLKLAIGSFVMTDIIKETYEDNTSKIKFDNIEVLLHYASIIGKEIKVIPFNKINPDYLPFYMKNGYLGYKDYKAIHDEFRTYVEHERVTVIEPS